MRQQKKCCPIQFKDDFEEFIEYLRLRPLRESTIKYQHDILIPILLNFDSYGVKSWNDLSPTDIYRVHQESRDKYNLIYPLRSFLQFLQKTGRILKDYTVYIPKNKKRYPTPSVYSKDEIKEFLESFDLDNPFERRNYTMALLALHLGLRGGDISNLRLTDVDFSANKITFIQQKTNVPHCLELVQEVKEPLKYYIKNIRPNSIYDNIFLSFTKQPHPIRGANIHGALKRHFLKSGILVNERKCGLHSLRMTFASDLIAEHVPYAVVGKILGHEHYQSAKRYIKFDIEALRNCALDVPSPTGKINQFIFGEGRLPL